METGSSVSVVAVEADDFMRISTFCELMAACDDGTALAEALRDA